MARAPAVVASVAGLIVLAYICLPALQNSRSPKQGQPVILMTLPPRDPVRREPPREEQPPVTARPPVPPPVTPVPIPPTPVPTPQPTLVPADLQAQPAQPSTDSLSFELPPLPTALQQLPNKLQEPSKWAGANWGPVKLPVDWSTAEAPLWRRELQVIRDQGKFPKHPTASMTNGDVPYAKNLQIFRAAPKEAFTVLEVGLHPAEQKRAPLYNFFKNFLPNSKYLLFANTEATGPLAEYLQTRSQQFHKGSTSDQATQGKVQQNFGTVDIIVGRAADGISGQLEAFRYFFVNLLRPGGVYFIEDIDMNFISTPDTDECVKTRTLMIDYLRDMISAQISHDWYMTTAGEYRADPFVNNWVQDVSCSRGSCVVTKRLKPFTRYASLTHQTPLADYDTAFATQHPPALSSLVKRDPHGNTDVSNYGPMLRPVNIGLDLPLWAKDANLFKAQSDLAGSDKCKAIHNGHQFHAMYSKVFAPWRAALSHDYHKVGSPVPKTWRMLEVGIGCDTQGDPAGGYRLYSQYIPNVEYFAFEFAWKLCLTKFSERSHIRDNAKYLANHVFVGDQSNYEDLKNTIRQYGTFDIIVDDGSHVSHMMISTFREMFIAALKPGGIFVIEDIQTSFMAGSDYGQSSENQIARLTCVDILRDMIVSLNYPSWVAGYDNKDSLYRFDEPVMNWVEDIMCSREACVIQKRLEPLSAGQ